MEVITLIRLRYIEGVRVHVPNVDLLIETLVLGPEHIFSKANQAKTTRC